MREAIDGIPSLFLSFHRASTFVFIAEDKNEEKAAYEDDNCL